MSMPPVDRVEDNILKAIRDEIGAKGGISERRKVRAWQIKDMFKKTAPANQAATPEAQEQGDNLMAQIDALDSQMQEGEMGGQANKPSLNTMVGNAQ